MDKQEVLAKSRTENNKRDIYEQEVLKQAKIVATAVMMIFAAIFFGVQIFMGEGINWGMWALVFSANMATLWVKYIKLRRRHELVLAIAYTLLVLTASGYHIYHLITSSPIL